MKKITIALMCMLLAAGAAMAQKRFTFGPKVGVDFTHFWGKETKSFWEFKGVFNYQAGAFFEYRFSDKFAIAPEVVFAAQGDKFNYNYEVYDENNAVIGEKEGTCSYKVNYIKPYFFSVKLAAVIVRKPCFGKRCICSDCRLYTYVGNSADLASVLQRNRCSVHTETGQYEMLGNNLIECRRTHSSAELIALAYYEIIRILSAEHIGNVRYSALFEIVTHSR